MSDLVIIDKEKIISELIIRLDRLERRVLELERENIFLRKENVSLKRENEGGLPNKFGTKFSSHIFISLSGYEAHRCENVR